MTPSGSNALATTGGTRRLTLVPTAASIPIALIRTMNLILNTDFTFIAESGASGALRVGASSTNLSTRPARHQDDDFTNTDRL